MSVNLPLDPNTTRKDYPLYSGLLSYFPNALAYVSYVSKKANDQHNPGEPLHWAREKSTDHADCLLRHLLKKGERDDDGLLETGKVAWRALALLEEELEFLSNPAVTAYSNAVGEPCTIYDWSKAPSWAMWAATGSGEGGVSCWFADEPSTYSGAYEGWSGRGCKWENMIANYAPTIPWKDSLEARPQKKQEPSFAEMTAKLPVCFERGAV